MLVMTFSAAAFRDSCGALEATVSGGGGLACRHDKKQNTRAG